MTRFQIGVLDPCFIPEGDSATRVLRRAVALAQRSEFLGYSRYWLTEHHGAWFAHASPESVIPAIASQTTTISVGAGGILLPIQTPLKVADNFRTIASIFPGRIELGLGRGLPSLGRIAALTMGGTADDARDSFERKTVELLHYLRDESSIKPIPVSGPNPQVWILGSGEFSAKLAAEHGTAYSHSLFLRSDHDHLLFLEHYPGAFRPSVDLKSPRWSIAVAGSCAESESEAVRNASSFSHLSFTSTVIGTPNQCCEIMYKISEQYRTSEILFTELASDFDARVRSLELLAAALDLSGD